MANVSRARLLPLQTSTGQWRGEPAHAELGRKWVCKGTGSRGGTKIPPVKGGSEV